MQCGTSRFSRATHAVAFPDSFCLVGVGEFAYEYMQVIQGVMCRSVGIKCAGCLG